MTAATVAAGPAPSPAEKRAAGDDKFRETWEAFKAAREKWWKKDTEANFCAYRAAEREFLDAWGAPRPDEL